MMKELWGSSEGLCKGKGGSMHVADFEKGILGANGIVAGGPPISVGAALAARIRGNTNVAVSFSGDGSVNQGTCFEAMNMAVVLQVPAIFVIENNYYSEHTNISYAVGCDDLKARTEAFGFPGVRGRWLRLLRRVRGGGQGDCPRPRRPRTGRRLRRAGPLPRSLRRGPPVLPR